MKYVVLEKPVGQTPLEAVTVWKNAHPDYVDIPASYAGRLDPMASGKLLVLLGEECKRQKWYTGLDKEYEIEILLDVGSDTGDALGLVESSVHATSPSSKQIRKALSQETGKKLLPYPAFSSKTVNGKPLFLYSLESTLDTIVIPEHEEHIYRLTHLSTETISCSELKARVAEHLSTAPVSKELSKALGADFRIHAVRNSWQAVFLAEPDRNFTIIRMRALCASGTYMRSLASRIGKDLGTDALALSIHRTRIGSYLHLGKFGYWKKQFHS